MPGQPAQDRRGAYGLALPGLAGQQWLNPAPEEWQTWRFVEQAGPRDARPELSDSLAVVQGEGERAEYIDRETATTTLTGGRPLPPHALVHPVLGNTAAVHAYWRGMLTFHSGSFLSPEGGAWGVLGGREQGKSSTLAWMAVNGYEVLSDDLTITDGEHALAGPRCIDLREVAARHLLIGQDLGGGGGLRRRWRVDLPPTVPEVQLRGWVVLRWADEVRIADVELADRARRLGAAVGLQLSEQPPLPWLGALAKPMIELSRPRSWEAVDSTMAELLECVDAAYR